MQIMAEALGLALPGTALMPSTSPDLLEFAREAGRQAVRIAKMEKNVSVRYCDYGQL